MVILHSFVGVDEDIYDVHLFRHFLEHYAAQGIDAFVFDLHSNVGAEDRIALFRSMLSGYPAEVRNIVVGPYTSHLNHIDYVNRFLADHGAPDRWCVLVDADEFVEFPGGAGPFLDACASEGCNVVIGNLVDRLSLDPPFPAVRPDEPLGAQFPWSYPLTRQIRRGVDRKVVAVRGRFSCVEGKHRLIEEPPGLAERERTFMRLVDRIPNPEWRSRLARRFRDREPQAKGIRRCATRLRVHHFAWDAVLLRKMQRRARMPGLTHPTEIRNVLAFVTGPAPLERRLRRHLLMPAGRFGEGATSGGGTTLSEKPQLLR